MPLTRPTINQSLHTAITVAEHFHFSLPLYGSAGSASGADARHQRHIVLRGG
jgi:hypothetical protein